VAALWTIPVCSVASHESKINLIKIAQRKYVIENVHLFGGDKLRPVLVGSSRSVRLTIAACRSIGSRSPVLTRVPWTSGTPPAARRWITSGTPIVTGTIQIALVGIAAGWSRVALWSIVTGMPGIAGNLIATRWPEHGRTLILMRVPDFRRTPTERAALWPE